MACCTKKTTQDISANRQQLNDVFVRPTWGARQRYIGKATGRDYGVIGRATPVWVHPDDYQASLRTSLKFELLPDYQTLAPSHDAIAESLAVDPSDPVAVLEAQIRKAGVRASFKPVIKHGFDIQQNPHELAGFLALAQKRGVKHVLEIGTGESAGLARFMTEVLGWSVVSVDIHPPSVTPKSDKWTFIQGDSKTVEIPHGHFDMVFIDGDHSFEGLKSDWERFSSLAPLVGIHDISEEGNYKDSVTKFWREIAHTKTGRLRSGFDEYIVEYSGMGIGVYERD